MTLRRKDSMKIIDSIKAVAGSRQTSCATLIRQAYAEVSASARAQGSGWRPGDQEHVARVQGLLERVQRHATGGRLELTIEAARKRAIAIEENAIRPTAEAIEQTASRYLEAHYPKYSSDQFYRSVSEFQLSPREAEASPHS